MKTLITKGLTILGIGAVMIGAFAAGPAKADDRCNTTRNNCIVGFDVRTAPFVNGRYIADNHYNDRDRSDRRDDHRR